MNNLPIWQQYLMVVGGVTVALAAIAFLVLLVDWLTS